MSKQELQAVICSRVEKARKLEVSVEGFWDASNIRTELAKGERCSASRAEEVRTW